MSIDRSKYKSSSVNVINSQLSPQNSNYTKNLTYNDGDNYFRIYPEHISKRDTIKFSYPHAGSFLEVMKPVYDKTTGEKTDKKEKGKKMIFNAKVHGGHPFDIVDEYHRIAREVAIPNFTDDPSVVDEINKILGYYKTGHTSVCYADKHTDKSVQFGALLLKSTVLTEMSRIQSELGVSEEPFTDPDEGIKLIVNKTGVGNKTKYTCRLETQKSGKFGFDLVPTPLTDEQLSQFETVTPLIERYVNVYKRSDFDFQVEGLKNLDEKLAQEGYPINVLSYEEMLSKISEMDDLLESSDDSRTEGEEGTSESGKEIDLASDKLPWKEL